MIAPGAWVGDFELIALLGRGGQGEVYLGCPLTHAAYRRRWLRLRLAAGAVGPIEARGWRLAAVKIAYTVAADSLHDEHGHLAAPDFCHPHLPRLYGRAYPGRARDFGVLAGDGGRRPYLALAYEPGRALEQVVRRGGVPSARWAVVATAQVARALAYLHGRGIVHHDVRPANVIVARGERDGPRCTLLDLGAADTPAAPRRRGIYGTADHLPPERLGARPAPPTNAVDVYGLGVLLRLLVAGRPLSPALTALLADATAPCPARRRELLPDMHALLARLAALPEAS